MLEEELTAALGRGRYRRGGERGGWISPRCPASSNSRLVRTARDHRAAGPDPKPEGGTAEWRSATTLPRYARITKQAETLIAATYRAGTNTRCVKRAVAALFKGAVGKDVGSRRRH